MVAAVGGAALVVATAGAATPVVAAAASAASTGLVAGTSAVAGAGAVSAIGAGSAAVAGATSVGAGAALGTAAGILAGPVGWIALGASQYTFDCWKPVLHDESLEPSAGKLLRDVAADPRIKQVVATGSGTVDRLPEIVLENIWSEQFRVEYVTLASGVLAAHAVRL